MTPYVFLFLFFLMHCLVLLWHGDWPHHASPRSSKGAVHARVQRLLRPRTPLDCPACCHSSTTWLTRAGKHAELFHERCFHNLHLPHLQLDELRTRLRRATRILWLWLAIDPLTKIIPVLQLGPRTQNMAHTVIHSLRRSLAPGCIPLFTSDGLNVYFYALTAHFGTWREERRRGRNVCRWQVEAGLIYGQVKNAIGVASWFGSRR